LTESADERGGRLKIRLNFILDELGNFTEIPAFSNLLMRRSRVPVQPFVQNISQIEHKYGREEVATITDNCHCWIYLKTANVETATQISKKLGQYTTSSYSCSSSCNSSGTSSGNVSNSMNGTIIRLLNLFANPNYAHLEDDDATPAIPLLAAKGARYENN
jgi:type IV secretion system protein VirD4